MSEEREKRIETDHVKHILPIDPKSVRLHAKRFVIADGRNEYLGEQFVYQMSVGKLTNAARIMSFRQSVDNLITYVLGCGIDTEESRYERRVIYDCRNLGLWAKTKIEFYRRWED